MTGLLLLLFAVVAGSFLPMQAGVNARLAQFVGGPVRASMISFGVGAIALFLVVLLFYRSEGHRASAAPWWAWVGGLCIAFAVTVQIVNAREEGTGPIIGLIVAGQLVCAMLVDHFGWLGMEREPINWWKAAGAVLLAGGAALIQVKS